MTSSQNFKETFEIEPNIFIERLYESFIGRRRSLSSSTMKYQVV